MDACANMADAVPFTWRRTKSFVPPSWRSCLWSLNANKTFTCLLAVLRQLFMCPPTHAVCSSASRRRKFLHVTNCLRPISNTFSGLRPAERWMSLSHWYYFGHGQWHCLLRTLSARRRPGLKGSKWAKSRAQSPLIMTRLSRNSLAKDQNAYAAV